MESNIELQNCIQSEVAHQVDQQVKYSLKNLEATIIEHLKLSYPKIRKFLKSPAESISSARKWYRKNKRKLKEALKYGLVSGTTLALNALFGIVT